MIKTKKAFTMIEIIFVIMIIGILSAVAIPRLFLMRDDAKISLCVQETTQFLSELSVYYTSKSVFTDVSKMTNLQTKLTFKGNGFSEDIDMNIPTTAGMGTSVLYKCDGLDSVEFQASIDDNGTVWITTRDGAKNSIGIGKNLSNILENKGFYRAYQVGGVNINYGFKNN
jgi:prepilin-type N-terminal cleavage/methylation domain-containing protein